MRWLLIALTFFLGTAVLEPMQAYAKVHHKKVHIHKHKKKAKKMKVKKVKKVTVKPSRNINSPHEGELLKLEGMVKDINEQ